eukprot:3108052-Pleurochrysis_carterae.AAC.1
MSAGTARIVTTRFADVMVAIDEEAASAPAPADGGGDHDSGGEDDLRDVEEQVHNEVEAEVAAAAPAAASSSEPHT